MALDFDPHQHTPVELLHVSSLGLVKYLWTDAMEKMSEAHKKELVDRLASVNVRGLGISPIYARPLVRHPGSLTGGDFRRIAQVAPFVLRPFVSDVSFEAWLAVAELQPLVWQPKIVDIMQHCVRQFNFSWTDQQTKVYNRR